MQKERKKVGRLAPTPSGRLHLGNVYAFAAAWLSVRQMDGRLLLRMEDVDHQRARPAYADAIRRELDWLGLPWDEEVTAQSERRYEPVLEALQAHTYYCSCTRRMLRPYGGLYPGWCRNRKLQQGALRFRLDDHQRIGFHDGVFGFQEQQPAQTQGDPVLRRRDGLYTYHLAVVADDIADGVTEVVRGADLLNDTGLQVALWRALGQTTPQWRHTPLVVGPDRRKWSKSQHTLHLDALQAAGWRAADVCRTVLPWLGLPPFDHWEDALPMFAWTNIPRAAIRMKDDPILAPHPKDGLAWRFEMLHPFAPS